MRRSLWVILMLLPAIGVPVRAGEEHWSLRPVTRPAVPEAGVGSAWTRNPIDALVLEKLTGKGLRPSAEADRATLLRRVSFDLTGLPPTPEEVEAFLKDQSADAYEKVVDRLLASPRYGERWARHWLDVVRYADSHGFEMNQPRANAWPYRDYVIRAFNEDKPYNQFVIEQLAGDAVGVDEATGFLVAGPYDQVKSPDPNLTAQQRMDELHDMVAATGATFLGLTVGCARCHNHKFDPIPQVDYYRMQAVFAGVKHEEREWRGRDTKEREKELGRLRPELADIEKQLAELEPLARVEHGSAAAPLRAPVNARKNVERFAPIEARFVRMSIEATNNLEPCVDELETYTTEERPRNVALGSGGAKATSSGNFAGSEFHKLEHLNDGRYGNSRSWISNEQGKGWVIVELSKTERVDRVVWGRDREGKYADRLAVKYRIEVATEVGKWQLVASSDDRVPFGKKVDQASGKFGELLQRQAELEKRVTELSAKPMVYAGKFEQPGPSYRLFRGEAMQKREAVTPGGLSCMPVSFDLPADAPEQQRRLALAKWIADPANPLTARVIVNRLWHYHFGRGIVATPSDFGRMGARPTHPELLDWLASELVQRGWKIKAIHRLIVLSATYRQGRESNATAAAVDADDALLWRWPPRRLEAEAIRDAMLAVSEKLDLKMGGPGFDVFKPNDNYVRVYEPKDQFGPAEWRRMIYQHKPRLQADGVFGAFDCPDGGQPAPRRSASTTPLQALNLLNGAFVLQQAEFFAERVRREAGRMRERK